MPADNNDAAQLHPSAVLASFGAGLFKGRRVAVLGDGSTGLAELIAAGSARQVHAYDPDATRAAESLARHSGGGGKVSHATLDEAIDLRAGSFDAVVIADLGELEDAEGALAQSHALLSPRGLLLLSSANPEGPQAASAAADRKPIGYYDLFDLVSANFDHVYMLGQAPFMGYSVAEFAAEGEPSVTIDSSLVEATEQPSQFVAVACKTSLQIDPYTLVQVPSSDAAGWLAPEPATAAIDAAKLAEAQLRQSLMDTELEELRERERQTARLAEKREATATALSAQVSELQADRDTLRADRDTLRADHDKLRADRDKLRADRDKLRADHDKLRADRDKLRADRDKLQATRDTLQTDRDKDSGELSRAHRQLERLEQRLADAERTLARERQELAHERQELARERQEKHESDAAIEEEHQKDLDAMLDRIAELDTAAIEFQTQMTTRPTAQDADEQVPDQVARAHEFQISELQKTLSQVRGERDKLSARAKRVSELEKKIDTMRRERAADDDDAPQEATDEDALHTKEIDGLERQLKERGQLVATLRKELAEAERVGRELVARLVQAEAKTADAPTVDDGEQNNVRERLESLLDKCARYEADLQSASWKISSLSASIDDQKDETTDQEKLEDALRQAHEQLASLKQQLTGRS